MPDLEADYGALVAMWRELAGKHRECAGLPPTPDGDAGDEIDLLAQLAGTRPATDPMIACWGRWSVQWNRRVIGFRNRLRPAGPASGERGTDVMAGRLCAAATDLLVLWEECDQGLQGREGEPAPVLKRLRRELEAVRRFLVSSGREAPLYDDCLPAP